MTPTPTSRTSRNPSGFARTPRNSWSSRIACALVAFGVLVPAAAAQEGDEDEPRRVLRDQSRMSVRLTSLREKMLRLSDRYETEGRTHNAQLLREALEQFEADDLLDQARDIEHNSDVRKMEQNSKEQSGRDSAGVEPESHRAYCVGESTDSADHKSHWRPER